MDGETARTPIDLRSDTVTTPSERMRRAAAEAAVGDDVYGEDPTVNDLEDAVATVLGTEDALFVPSGTMGNQIAARTHTERGREVIAEASSHVVTAELAGLAQHGGLQAHPIDTGPEAVPTPETVRDAHVARDLHRPGTGLLCLENTHNLKGGVVATPAQVAAAAEAAHDLGVPVHLDGARLFNAAVAADVDAAAFAEPVDSVSVCFSKGLGAPVGSALCGSAAFVERARRARKLLGGGMRQAGLLAAPARIALAENVDRLADDHANAARLAAGLASLDGLDVTEPETNIVIADTEGVGLPDASGSEGSTADAFVSACGDAGVLASAFGAHTVRFCTHLDVDAAAVDAAVDRIVAAV